MIRRLIVLLRIWSVRAVFEVATRLPLRDRVVLATSRTSRLGGNLSAIKAEINTRRPKIPVVTVAHRREGGALGRLRALWHGMVAGYWLATSRLIIVDDFFFPIYVVTPREGTTRVQTWHASGPFKKFGYSALGKDWGVALSTWFPSAGRRTPPVRVHANYDICLVGSRAAVPAFAEAFRLPEDRFVFELGIPRTDALFGAERIERTVEALHRHYAIPADRKVVLYAPTFRGATVSAARQPEGVDLDQLRAAIGRDWVLLLRQHPFVRAPSATSSRADGFVIDVSDHPEINELLLVSDALITDYSSVIFEFSLLGRPMVFFAPDYAEYEQERGLYFDYRAFVPGPVFVTTEALAEYLGGGHLDTQSSVAFAKHWFDVADGHASERFVDGIVIPALAGEQVRGRGAVRDRLTP
jgi:CDP-ribitol ribitolphosphotransferase